MFRDSLLARAVRPPGQAAGKPVDAPSSRGAGVSPGPPRQSRTPPPEPRLANRASTAGERRIRVGVICRVEGYREVMEAKARSVTEVDVADARTGHPDVWLCAAGSARAMVALIDSLDEDALARVVLVDLAGDIGPFVAGQHHLLGYLPPTATPTQYRTCLQSAARRRAYAPEQCASDFHAARAHGPFTPVQREILMLEPQGLTQTEMEARLFMSRGAFQTQITRLRKRLELEGHHSLAAAADELGFSRVWPLLDPER